MTDTDDYRKRVFDRRVLHGIFGYELVGGGWQSLNKTAKWVTFLFFMKFDKNEQSKEYEIGRVRSTAGDRNA